MRLFTKKWYGVTCAQENNMGCSTVVIVSYTSNKYLNWYLFVYIGYWCTDVISLQENNDFIRDENVTKLETSVHRNWAMFTCKA